MSPYVYLAMTYRQLKEDDKYFSYLKQAATKKGVPPNLLAELTILYLNAGDLANAKRTLRQAQALGLDPNQLQQLLTKFPQLRN